MLRTGGDLVYISAQVTSDRRDALRVPVRQPRFLRTVPQEEDRPRPTGRGKSRSTTVRREPGPSSTPEIGVAMDGQHTHGDGTLRCLPWQVRDEHLLNRHGRMLCLDAASRHGVRMRYRVWRGLAEWRLELAELNAVVAYDPDSVGGFTLSPRQAGDADKVRPPSTGAIP